MRQWNGLAIAVQHVLDFDLSWLNPQNPVSAVHNVSFVPDEDVFTARQEDALALTGFIREVTRHLQLT